MIKLVVFDLDGVLMDARDIHYHALNRALAYVDKKYEITREEHLAKYDGLSTFQKLSLLHKDKEFPLDKSTIVWKLKQEETLSVIRETIKPIPNISDCIGGLHADGYKLFCASNATSNTVHEALKALGIYYFFENVLSNESVNQKKPHSEIYLRCMIDAEVNPKETLICEDSHLGREAAHNSGAHVMGVISTADVTYDNVKEAIAKAESNSVQIKPKWQGGRMNVLIPMAGAGSRFEKAGYTFPKPLVEVHNKPMIQLVTENLNIDARHIYIVQQAHYEKYNLKHMLNLISPGCVIVQVNGVTEGAACTTLLARQYIDNNDPLLIANSDQYIEWNSNQFLYAMQSEGVHAGILTFDSVHPKWSYARVDENGWVVEVAEKKPISRLATVGVYYWKFGGNYVACADEMIKRNIRVNNEFYVCPVFNQAIEHEYKIKTYHIDKMWGLGTPEDLEIFLKEKPSVT